MDVPENVFCGFLCKDIQQVFFPASSGSADNFHIYVGLGRLTVDGRKGLFAGEHMEGEENLQFGMGKGIVLIDGQNLRALVLPKISKKKILGLLQN